MKIRPGNFRLRAGDKVNLNKWPTVIEPVYASKAGYRKLLERHVEQLSAMQQLHYSTNRDALLMIFQGMDAAGKDGVIRHVMSGVNPQGCQVTSFKTPSATELQHDFLWRTARELPERGHIGIFNRSYYEEVLIVRVHRSRLREEGLAETSHHGRLWHDRYRSIRNFEQHLAANGTQVIKLFLHLSKDEQRRRFLARIDDPAKNWKLDLADLKERGYWKEYAGAYEECLAATSTEEAPWYIVPADDKENARLIVSTIVLDAFEQLHMHYPKAGAKQRRDLLAIRRRLLK